MSDRPTPKLYGGATPRGWTQEEEPNARINEALREAARRHDRQASVRTFELEDGADMNELIREAGDRARGRN